MRFPARRRTIGGRKQTKASWVEVGGKRFFARSDWEISYACLLEAWKRDGQIMDWSYEPKTFWFEGIRRGTNNYKPDFGVEAMPGAQPEYHEVKGWMDSKSKTKIKRMAKYHPDVRLIVRDASWCRRMDMALACARASIKPKIG